MESDDAQIPVVNSIPTTGLVGDVPEITALEYRLGDLTLTLQLADETLVSVRFEAIRGFRVLDEGDLLEFWNPPTRAEGWLWSVKDGGWYAQEARRDGFMFGIDTTCSEFLVLGQNDCVSVITENQGSPMIWRTG